ncbi:MAG: heavy metal translocating P-type ATPase [Gaiellales bacterium]
MPNASESPARSRLRLPGYHTLLTIVVLTFLAAGVVLWLLDMQREKNLVWAAADILVLLPLSWGVLRALRAGQFGVDIIALLAIVGALATGEYLAGAVIALMLSGGNALEEYAEGRAGRELKLLVTRAPRHARVRRGTSTVEIAATDVQIGDVLVVRQGELVAADGYVVEGAALVDQATLTGEPLPVNIDAGATVMSGSANVGEPFELMTLRPASESMYATIVRLVEQAIERKAPMVRMADRYSVLFLIVTLVLTAAAWIVSGDPVRAVAVLVIATPCPLILAPPVALVAGTSRAARRGVIVKGSATIEALSAAGSVLLDKTGTLTLGTPSVQRVVTADGQDENELLRLAGSVEQLSMHTLARAITEAATARVGALALPQDAREQPGHGIAGTVDDAHVHVGSRSFLEAAGVRVPEGDAEDGMALAHVARDGEWIGRIELADTLRDDAKALVSMLKQVGISRVVMATGDHADAARAVAEQLGIEELHADCTPDEKLQLIETLRREGGGHGVIMVGDGINDAPALAAADVGFAMGSAGASAASEAAEAVVISERVTAVAEAISIGRRSTSIARQSVVVGMGLSMIGMVVAAAGYLPPVYGALGQEVIDLAVIFNAMRALTGPLPMPGGSAID